MCQKQSQNQPEEQPKFKPRLNDELRSKGGKASAKHAVERGKLATNQSEAGKASAAKRGKGWINQFATTESRRKAWSNRCRNAGKKGGQASSLGGVPRGMTREEVRKSMARAKRKSKIDPELPEDVKEYLGITTNPAQILEMLLIAEHTPIKDKIAIATKLMDYTHQKQATKQEITQEVVTHTSFLDTVRDNLQHLEYDKEAETYVAPNLVSG